MYESDYYTVCDCGWYVVNGRLCTNPFHKIPGKGKTQAVRILIAIDHEGNWVATGASSAEHPDEPKEWIQIDNLSEHMSYHWVVSHVPVPLEMTLPGKVEE